MNLSKLLVGLSVSVGLLLSLSGCSIEIPNVKTHVILPSGDVYFKYLNTDTEGKIRRDDWNLVRVGMFCHTAEDFGELLRFIDKACAKHKDCTINKIELEKMYKFVAEMKYR